jgi:hypothetical protein
MKRIAFGAWALFVCTFPTISHAQENMSEVQFVPHFISIHESGSFLGKTIHEMDTDEFRAGLSAACAALGCSAELPAMAAAIHVVAVSSGGDFATTGRIDKHQGEDWLIAFPAPPGYVTCSAAYDPNTISANHGDTTTGTVFRNPATGENWVGSYNEVPLHRPEGHWVNVNFVVKYVKAGTEGSHNCVPNGTRVWSVH